MLQSNRWRQFSLRSLMVLLFLWGVGLLLWNVYTEPYRRQAQLVAQIRELKGSVNWEETFLSRLLHNDLFQDVVLVDLSKTSIDDARLDNLRNAPRLRILQLYETAIGDAGLAHVTQWKELGALDLYGTKITDAGLAPLKTMPRLVSVNLGCTGVGDDGLSQLPLQTKTLHLRFCPVTDAGMSHIAKLVNLKNLDLRDTLVTDEGIAHLAKLEKLEWLMLENTDVTENGLQHLKALPVLRDLSVGGSSILPSAFRPPWPQLVAPVDFWEVPPGRTFVDVPLLDFAHDLSGIHQTAIVVRRRGFARLRSPVTR